MSALSSALFSSPNGSPSLIYKFGTSGYRNDSEAGFNESVIRQITGAIADYFISQLQHLGLSDCAATFLVGGDTRQKTKEFAPLVAQLLMDRGFDVALAEGDIPTPVLAYAAAHLQRLGFLNAHGLGAVLMTASHNPWPYGGYNFLTNQGAVAPSDMTKEFEALQASPKNLRLNRVGHLTSLEPYMAYRRHLIERVMIDFPAISAAHLQIFYSPLYATGRKYLPRLLSDEGIELTMIQGEDTPPEAYTGMPNPVAAELLPLIEAVRSASPSAGISLGLANDGDADRFGVVDEAARMIDANEILALVLWHQLTNRIQQRPLHGCVVRSQATSHKLDALAKQAGLEVIQTPVGYKYIAECFIEHEAQGGPPILLGGESSGGLSIDGHIPEKDGLLANLLVLEAVAKSGLPLSRLLEKINASLPQRYAFNEAAIRTPDGQRILEAIRAAWPENKLFGKFVIDMAQSQEEAEKLQNRFGTRDGVKLYFAPDNTSSADGVNAASWILVRASGTEPLLRVYTEGVASSQPEAEAICHAQMDAAIAWLQANFNITSVGSH
ncbi:MAG: hypothetical protein VKK59_04870 [Vampirovibrionales bacterium]|nr:hypothetical protein [Vampirovibrionales bacterium]